MKEKSAREMFEELGFEYDEEAHVAHEIRYIKKEESVFLDKGEMLTTLVSFEVDHEDYIVECETDDFSACVYIDSSLHKAITKQMEELGWI